MNHYAGIDVSLELSSVCVVDGNGKIVREGKVASEPVALIAWLRATGVGLERVGLEAGPLSQWLHRAMKEAGLPVELLETRHVRDAFKAMAVKTDRKDAARLARLHRAGELTAVAAPTPEQEAVRDLTRARQAAQQDLHRLRQRLRTLLLRLGVADPTTTKRWSARWRVWLAGLSLEQAAQPICPAWPHP